MKKKVIIVGFLVSLLVLLLAVGLLKRRMDKNDVSTGSDSGVEEVEEIELLPDSLVF